MLSIHRMLLINSILATLLLHFSTVDAHGHLFLPKARESGPVQDPSGTMGCSTPNTGPISTYKVGETIQVRYWRNNHIGGFIRWAISPKGKESGGDFDANVFQYTCRESGPECHTRIGDWWSEDATFPAPNATGCGDTITLPNWLPEGDYVLQWTWFSAGSYYGALEQAEFNYKSCADIHLVGGVSGARPQCPKFTGGDRVSHNEGQGDNVCFYIGTNFIPNYRFIGSLNTPRGRGNYKFGRPAAIDSCVETPPPTTAPPPPPPTTPTPTEAPTEAPTEVPTESPKEEETDDDTIEGSDASETGSNNGLYIFEGQEFETKVMEAPVTETKSVETPAPTPSVVEQEISEATMKSEGQKEEGTSTLTILTSAVCMVGMMAATVIFVVRKKQQELNDHFNVKSPEPTPLTGRAMEATAENMLVTPTLALTGHIMDESKLATTTPEWSTIL